MASRRTSNQRSASSASDSSSLFYESQFYYNVPSSSSKASSSSSSSYSPPPTYTPLARREERAADPYRAISDDQRWLRRVRQQQQEARLQAQSRGVNQQQPRRSFDSPRITLDTTELSDEEDDDGVLEDEQQYVPVSLAMHRQSSSESQSRRSSSSRSRTMSGSSTTSSIAFAAVPPSPQRATSTIPTTPVYATSNQQMPLWHQIPAPPQGKYALPSYSPPDPSSPFTFTNTLFEDEDECGSSFIEETPRGKRGALLKKTRRDSNGELPSSPTSVKSCSASVHSTDSASSLPDSPSKLDSAKRQWDLLSLRVSLRVFHAKQNLSNGLHLRGISSPPHN